MHFAQFEITVELFATSWIIGLFAQTIPFSQIDKFFGMFFRYGWIVVYKITLLILRSFSRDLLGVHDSGEILNILKNKDEFQTNFKPNNKRKCELFWEKLLVKVEDKDISHID